MLIMEPQPKRCSSPTEGQRSFFHGKREKFICDTQKMGK